MSDKIPTQKGQRFHLPDRTYLVYKGHMTIEGIPEGYIDAKTGKKIFYHDDIAQKKYERRLHLLTVIRQTMARRAAKKQQPTPPRQ